MVKITWHNGAVPEGMKIKQVYGLLFTEDGRFLVRIENKPKGKVYTLAGGTPEKFDKNEEATLRRFSRSLYGIRTEKFSGEQKSFLPMNVPSGGGGLISEGTGV